MKNLQVPVVMADSWCSRPWLVVLWFAFLTASQGNSVVELGTLATNGAADWEASPLMVYLAVANTHIGMSHSIDKVHFRAYEWSKGLGSLLY